MRRSMLLVGSLAFTLVGCGGDAFSAHADVAAEAAGQELPTARVVDILTQVKGLRANAQAAEFVASLWVDYTLFSQAVADGSISADSAMIAKAMWVDVAEFTAGHWIDTLVARRAAITPAAVDSAYNADDARVLQHVLIIVDPAAPEAARVTARRTADRILADAKGGANFGALALANSGDPSAQADSGYLPPSPRGAFVPPFDSAAWLLAPGELSEVVVTSFGFHVIRRPPLDEVAGRLEAWLGPQMVGSMQTAYFAELDSLNEVKLSNGAAAKARKVIENLDRARNGKGKLVSYKGGGLTEGMLAQFIRAMTQDPGQGPQVMAQLKQLPDSLVEPFIKDVSRQFLLLRDAENAGITVTAAEWSQITAAYNASIDTLKSVIGLGEDVIDPSAPLADRRRAAALRVERFFDEELTGSNRLRLLPGMLAWTLGENSTAFVNPAGIQQVVSLAEAMLNDSTAAGALGRAPGGPPVPGTATSPILPATGGAPLPDGQQ
jgi:peptidyl-prolyl cis-trans isomerase D